MQIGLGASVLLWWASLTVLTLCSGSNPALGSTQGSSQKQTSEVKVEQRQQPNSQAIEAKNLTEDGGGPLIASTSSDKTSRTTTSPVGGKRKSKSRRVGECEYQKEPWQECQANGKSSAGVHSEHQQETSAANQVQAPSGIQRRLLRLKGDPAANPHCKPIKTVERECKLVGCKYARGEWSSSCTDGRRSRVDTLVGAWMAPDTALGRDGLSRCPARRTVSKDCKRACHYVKSAWSECVNGFKTRNVTLDLTIGDPAKEPTGLGAQSSRDAYQRRCAKERLIRRPCRASEATNARQTTGGSPGGLKQQQIRGGSKSSTTKTVAAQKRRLQKQPKFQQPHKGPSEANNGTGKATAGDGGRQMERAKRHA